MHQNKEQAEPKTNAERANVGLLADALARLPEKTILDERQLAATISVSPRTIRRMVARFELPPPIRLGGHSVWFAGRVLAHLENAAERAAREAERQAARIERNLP